MAASPKRKVSSFSLSFLDIMVCGFGAVVLLVLIINADTLSEREHRVAEAANQRLQEEMEHRVAMSHLEQRRAELVDLENDLASLKGQSAALQTELEQLNAAVAAGGGQGAEREKRALQQELVALEEKYKSLAKQKTLERQVGRQTRAVVGPGNRQYLTGLKLTGERVLILIDSSASMLDTKIVDVVRRKVRDADSRRSAPKWQRAVATAEWIVANLPSTSSIQIHHFSSSTQSFGGKSGESWTPVTRFERVDEMMAELRKVAPLGGTNLGAPFLKARSMAPKPDNIILLTDGLPTLEKKRAGSGTIDGAGRVKLYERAKKKLPAGVPVNTILFPIEGDPLAAALFWKLAVDTGGSFFTPTRDWP